MRENRCYVVLKNQGIQRMVIMIDDLVNGGAINSLKPLNVCILAPVVQLVIS